MNNTPLRYPGGKSVMTAFFENVIQYNDLHDVVYSEPYAGGSGAAINLLLNNSVSAIRINDASIAIYSFWHSLVSKPDAFLNKVHKVEVSLEEWKKQRKIFKESKTPNFDLGFATFFLSRTNRSGILGAGPIGGQSEESQSNTRFKIDCRFNKNDLLKRLEKIIAVRDRIYISNLDAVVFLKEIPDQQPLVYLDPPYYHQGKALYLNYYKPQDHVNLARFLKYSANFQWILSYDNVPEILELYSDFPLYQFNLSYTAQQVKKGSELLTHSFGLSLPPSLDIQKRRSAINIPLVAIIS